MPSNRKRIGYLPSEEVHNIIEDICKNNRFSQSKVTGILVEEALRSRGILNNKLNASTDNLFERNINKANRLRTNFNNDDDDDLNLSTFNNFNKKDELKIIDEFIEFKFFKKVMSQKKGLLD